MELHRLYLLQHSLPVLYPSLPYQSPKDITISLLQPNMDSRSTCLIYMATDYVFSDNEITADGGLWDESQWIGCGRTYQDIAVHVRS